jgi:hypothetical protein
MLFTPKKSKFKKYQKGKSFKRINKVCNFGSHFILSIY